VAQLARRQVTVAVSGVGGDELFGGYRRYAAGDIARRLGIVPRALLRSVGGRLARLLSVSGHTRLQDSLRLAQKFVEHLELPVADRYVAWNSFFSSGMKAELFARAVDDRLPSSCGLSTAYFARAAASAFPDRAMYTDLKTYLPGDPLCLADRMTMAHSLEARAPFLDRELVEYAARIPHALKIRGGRTKCLLREAVRGLVPPSILHRPKHGFATPIDLWLRRELKGWMEAALDRETVQARGYFRPEVVQRMVEQHRAGGRDFSQHLWALIVFELWHRMFIDNDMSDRSHLTLEDLGCPGVAGPSRCTTADPETRPRPHREPLLKREDGLPSPVVPSPARPEASTAPREIGTARSMEEESTASGSPAGFAPNARLRPAPRRPLRTQGALSILMTADVDPVYDAGGAARILREHSRRLAARGHRVTVLVPRRHPDCPPSERLDGVQVHRHHLRPGADVRAFARALRERARAYQRLAADTPFDLLNAHQPLAACALLQGAGRERPPLIYTFHSPWAHEYAVCSHRTGEPHKERRSELTRLAAGLHHVAQTGLRNHVEHYVLARSRRTLALSRFSASQLHDLHEIEPARVEVVPGGVDTERFRPSADRLDLRRRLRLPVEGPLLLTVQPLGARMRLEELIEAVQCVRKTYAHLSLVIAGADPRQNALRLQAAALDLGTNVIFAGELSEAALPEYHAAADLVLMPTRRPLGWNTRLLEALACGTPVAATAFGVHPEQLQPLDVRLLLPGTRAEDLAEWLIRRLPRVLGDEALRARCREHVVERYSWDRVMLRIELLFYEAAVGPLPEIVATTASQSGTEERPGG
jgi:glycosyltransferase involved in cell wall biosynthesis